MCWAFDFALYICGSCFRHAIAQLPILGRVGQGAPLMR